MQMRTIVVDLQDTSTSQWVTYNIIVDTISPFVLHAIFVPLYSISVYFSSHFHSISRNCDDLFIWILTLVKDFSRETKMSKLFSAIHCERFQTCSTIFTFGLVSEGILHYSVFASNKYRRTGVLMHQHNRKSLSYGQHQGCGVLVVYVNSKFINLWLLWIITTQFAKFIVHKNIEWFKQANSLD